MHTTIEKVLALLRQGQVKRAIPILERVLQELPRDSSEDSDEITLELSLPLAIPSVNFEISLPSEEGDNHSILIDKENKWVIGEEEEAVLRELCAPIQSIRYPSIQDINAYKMSVAAKLKEMIMQEKIRKR